MIDCNDLIDKPFELGARGPDAFDCWGLVLCVLRRLDLVVPPDRDSCGLSMRERIAFGRDYVGQFERIERPVDGCVVYAERQAHCGVYLHGRILHAVQGHGVLSWHLSRWGLLFPESEFYRWPG